MNQATRPLFQFDPGWLFIAAGLVVCASGVLLPAQGDLDALRTQQDHLKAEETRAYARLKAHSDFMDQVDRADPALVRRLAAAQLNMIPEGDTPVLLVSAANSPVTDWIDATVTTDIRPNKPRAASILSRLSNGPHRLWLFGGGIMSVFVGLLLSPGPVRLWRRTQPALELGDDRLCGNEVADLVNQAAIVEIDAFQEIGSFEPVLHIEPKSSAASEDRIDASDDESTFEDDAGQDTTEDITASEATDSGLVKSDVLLEPRMDTGIELSAFDLLDEDLQDELNEIEQADDRRHDADQSPLSFASEPVAAGAATETDNPVATNAGEEDSEVSLEPEADENE